MANQFCSICVDLDNYGIDSVSSLTQAVVYSKHTVIKLLIEIVTPR